MNEVAYNRPFSREKKKKIERNKKLLSIVTPTKKKKGGKVYHLLTSSNKSVITQTKPASLSVIWKFVLPNPSATSSMRHKAVV